MIERQLKHRRGAAGRVRGFTFAELLVLICIVVVLISIFIPYLLEQRETANRLTCADHLRQLGQALSHYAMANDQRFPRALYDQEKKPNSYTAFTGADALSPFTGGKVAANDVTASLWLLVRGGYAPPAIFVCPSSSDQADGMTDASGKPATAQQRSNFRAGSNLSYSYCSPFTAAPKFYLADWLPPDFAVAADKNPGVTEGSDVTGVAYNASPEQVQKANSRNHRRAGQNVLYPSGHVEFRRTPYCGVEGDNIYTALATQPLPVNVDPQMKVNGVIGHDVGPAFAGKDSYLVPTDSEGK